MPRKCIVPGCPTNPKEGKTFFSFTQCLKQRVIWLKKLKLTEKKIPSSAVICEIHFSTDHIIVAGRQKHLKPDAVPLFKIPVRKRGGRYNKQTQKSLQQDQSIIVGYCSTAVYRCLCGSPCCVQYNTKWEWKIEDAESVPTTSARTVDETLINKIHVTPFPNEDHMYFDESLESTKAHKSQITVNHYMNHYRNSKSAKKERSTNDTFPNLENFITDTTLNLPALLGLNVKLEVEEEIPIVDHSYNEDAKMETTDGSCSVTVIATPFTDPPLSSVKEEVFSEHDVEPLNSQDSLARTHTESLETVASRKFVIDKRFLLENMCTKCLLPQCPCFIDRTTLEEVTTDGSNMQVRWHCYDGHEGIWESQPLIDSFSQDTVESSSVDV